MVSKKLQILLLITLLGIAACKKNRPSVRAPIVSAPRLVYTGPSTELENQSTSTSIMVESLPAPASTSSEAQPSIPPPSRPTNSKPSRASVEPKREPKSPATAEARNEVHSPLIQLAPRIRDDKKQEYTKEINDHLEAAKSLIKSVNKSQLNQNQQTNLAAIEDFIKKSEDAMKRGEYHQGLVLAQKANTLAASIANSP